MRRLCWRTARAPSVVSRRFAGSGSFRTPMPKVQSQALARLSGHFCPESRTKWRSALFDMALLAILEQSALRKHVAPDISPGPNFSLHARGCQIGYRAKSGMTALEMCCEYSLASSLIAAPVGHRRERTKLRPCAQRGDAPSASRRRMPSAPSSLRGVIQKLLRRNANGSTCRARPHARRPAFLPLAHIALHGLLGERLVLAFGLRTRLVT